MVILGLLSHEPMSGYDIKKQIDGTIRYFWKGSFGSIYPAVAALEKDGFIEKTESDTGRQERVVYSITEAGRESLLEWLKTSTVKNEMKYETLLKLFFGGIAEKEVSIHTIEEFEHQVKLDLEQMRLFQRNLSRVLDEPGHIYYYLTVLFGIEMYEGYLRWCETAKKTLLEAGKDAAPSNN